MYTSLHNRSAYSFGSSLTTPEQLAEAAATMGMPAVALTDLDGLYAAVPFQQACRKAGIRPILGVELRLNNAADVTLLARDSEGYGNLCRLVSIRHLRGDPLGVDDLCEHAEGITCLINGAADIQRDETRSDNTGLVRASIRSLREAFAQHLYVTLSFHSPDDVSIARRRAGWADEWSIPVVATCQSRCLQREQSHVLRALSSIGTLTLLDQPHPDKPLGSWHFRTPSEMAALFKRRPDALENTSVIAEQCDFSFDLTRNRFPGFSSPDGRSAMEHLRELCVAGCRRRYVEQPQQRGIGG